MGAGPTGLCQLLLERHLGCCGAVAVHGGAGGDKWALDDGGGIRVETALDVDVDVVANLADGIDVVLIADPEALKKKGCLQPRTVRLADVHAWY